MLHPHTAGVRCTPLLSCVPLILLLLLAPQAVSAHGDARPDKTGILLAAFGTSVPEAQSAYDKLEALVRREFPDVPLHWAYTSGMVRRKLAQERPEAPELFSPAAALTRMADAGFTHVAVLSLHVLPGEEYHGLVRTAQALAGLPKGLKQVRVSLPLLARSEDLEAAAKAIREAAPQRAPGEALVLMGHGTHHPADVVYAAMQYHFDRLGKDVLVGTVEGFPSLDDVLALLRERGFTKATLMPLMTVAGDHARNDMAGDEDDSWKPVLEAAGIGCTPVLAGLAEHDAVARLWVEQLRTTMQALE